MEGFCHNFGAYAIYGYIESPIVISSFGWQIFGSQDDGRFISGHAYDNGSSINVCLMRTTTKIRLTKGQLSPSSLTVQAYDESSRGVIGTFEAECQLGPVSSSVLFHILEITTSYNLLLGRAWMHPLGIVPSTVHQKLKLPWKGGFLTILGDGEISLPVCNIKSNNDIQLRNFEVMKTSSVVIASIMKKMGYQSSIGLGKFNQGIKKLPEVCSQEAKCKEDFPYNGFPRAKEEASQEVKPIKQKLRRMKPEWMLKIKEEVVKLLKAGFIKADDFPLPHIDVLVDNTTRKCIDVLYGQFLKLLKKGEPKEWTEDCQKAFEAVKEYSSNPPVLAPPKLGRPLNLYLSVIEDALGSMLAQEDEDNASGRQNEPTEVSLREARSHRKTAKNTIKGRLIAEHCVGHLVSEDDLDDDFPDEDVLNIEEKATWKMYFDGASNQHEYGVREYEACIVGLEALLAINVKEVEIYGDSALVLAQAQRIWKMKEEHLKPYQTYLERVCWKFTKIEYTYVPRAQNQFADALATLASLNDEINDGKPRYHDICNFVEDMVYLEGADRKDIRALKLLATQYILCGGVLYQRCYEGVHLRCVDNEEAEKLIKEVHQGVCGPHMNGRMFAKKIIHSNLNHLPPEGAVQHDVTMAILSMSIESQACGQVHREQHHMPVMESLMKSSQTMESTNKNVKVILEKTTERYRDWADKLPFALWGYYTSIRTSTGMTPYSLVYGMEVVLLVEIEGIRGGRPRAFNKKVKPRNLKEGDLVLKELRAPVFDPRRKFKPNWAGPYVIKTLFSGGAVNLDRLHLERRGGVGLSTMHMLLASDTDDMAALPETVHDHMKCI
uniref:Uncharacterized protein n=1 Tax=Fagus sylvatica TaxID=28930 RepID=A0A2N9EMI8_FAGSY